MAKQETSTTVSKAIQVLKCFSANRNELSLTDISKEMDISLSSLQRLLNTLTEEGFLEKNEQTKTYTLGLELYFLGNFVEANSQLLTVTKKHMQQLNDQTGEAITLNVVNQDKRKCIGYIVAKYELTTVSYLSKHSPLYAGASAKVLLAYLPEEKKKKLINEFSLESLTEHTVKDKEMLRRQLEEIKEKGYAFTVSERINGVHAISAPIKNRLGEVIASLTITTPLVRVNESKSDLFIQLLLNCTNEITKDISMQY